MWFVYHHTICPLSRKLRLVLLEKSIQFSLKSENFWEKRQDFLHLNPNSRTPVIIIKNSLEYKSVNIILKGNFAIHEYIEEELENLPKLLPKNNRYFVREIVEWFDCLFYEEVTKHIIYEKIIPAISLKNGISDLLPPNSHNIRVAKKQLLYHMDYISYLISKNQYIAGDYLTLADYSVASHISILDMMGEITWSLHPQVKNWYSLIKSRPALQNVLKDTLPNIKPPSYYMNPDF
ncbi:MAG: glutathione S-transferase family protein [Proteobacteria bacterium]|nr:glutathione S-transferase family protein [Pseudomonadota bacterium]